MNAIPVSTGTATTNSENAIMVFYGIQFDIVIYRFHIVDFL
ncbi:MAG: hypothetical protein R2796_05400 [Chitinophagaceae bacterium]